MELESLLHLIENFGDFSLMVLKAVTDEQMWNQVQEDKDSSSCTESNMLASVLNLETFTHWSLNIVQVITTDCLREWWDRKVKVQWLDCVHSLLSHSTLSNGSSCRRSSWIFFLQLQVYRVRISMICEQSTSCFQRLKFVCILLCW